MVECPPPEFLDFIYVIEPVFDHVAKFHSDRQGTSERTWRKKKKHHEQNRRPPVLPYGQPNYSRYITYVCGCVGEWSRRQRQDVSWIHWRALVASSLVNRHRTQRTGSWLPQSSHSAHEQWTRRTTLLCLHNRSSHVAISKKNILQRTLFATFRCAQLRWFV